MEACSPQWIQSLDNVAGKLFSNLLDHSNWSSAAGHYSIIELLIVAKESDYYIMILADTISEKIILTH